jgi:hypothetical protein
MSQTKAQLLDTLVASLLPASDSSVDIGSNAVRFANIYGDTLYGNGANLTGINTDLVSDTSPQLGGNLDVNTKNILFGDSASASDDRLIFGAGSDLSIYHTGTNSYIQNSTLSSLFINSAAHIYLANSDNSEYRAKFHNNSSVQLYFDNSKKFETTSNGVEVHGHVRLDDNYELRLGTRPEGGDLILKHDGSNSFITDAGTGDLIIHGSQIVIKNSDNNEFCAKFIQDGAVELYHNNSKKFETTSAGVSVTGDVIVTSTAPQIDLVDSDANSDFRLKCNSGSFHIEDITNVGNRLSIDSSGDVIIHNDLDFPDNSKIKLGTGDDLELYHDGTNSIINHTLGSGALRVQANDVRLMNNAGNEHYVVGFANSYAGLYFDNSQKFKTLSTGAKVIGQLNFDDGSSTANTNGIGMGTSQDCRIFHDGSSFQVRNTTGPMTFLTPSFFRVAADSSNDTMIKATQDGSVELYHDNYKNLEVIEDGLYLDNDAAQLTIYLASQGTTRGYIFASSTIGFKTAANEWAVQVANNGPVELYYDNAKKFETTSDGVMVLNSGTNARINFNAASGTRGYVYADNANNIGFLDANANDWMVKCSTDAAVELYHDGSKKVETISAGIRVTGDYVGDNDWIKVSKLTSYDTTKSPIQQNSKTYWYTRLDDANSIQSSEFRNLAGSGGNSNSFQSTIIPVGNMTRQSDAGSFSAYNSSTNTQATRTNLANADDFNIATKGMSMGCLVRLENTGSNGSGIIFYGDGNSDNHFFSRYKYNGHGLMIGEDTNGSDNWTAAYPTSFFNDGDWRFVVMAVATNGTLMVSINGDRLTPVRLTGSVPTPSDAFFGIQGDTYDDNAARHRFATFWWYEGVISDALVAQEYAWMKTIWTSASGLT